MINISTMRKSQSSGFTIIETIVTLAIVVLFVTFFFQLYMTTESQRLASLRRTTASDLAYTNLRKFAAKPAGLTCTAAMDLSLSSSAGGTVVSNGTYSFTAESVPAILGQNVTQVVTAYAPSGCASYNANPVKLISEVSYGSNNDKVVHAAYVN